MQFGGLHFWDYVVLAAYLVCVLWIGRRAKATAQDEEGFFLAGRKLGRFYQFFLNCGNATEPQGAISTASFVYQQGGPGAWLSFQTVFTNPYLWFMMVWFRRARLTTVSDLFEERFGSKGLGVFYAIFQVLVVAIFLGFGNFTTYKIVATLAQKSEAQWTVDERRSVQAYRELQQLKELGREAPLSAAQVARLQQLTEKELRGELRASFPLISAWTFYMGISLVIGTYIIMGGLAAAAAKDVIQSALMVLFSVLLIPPGLAAIGGISGLAEKVPKEMLRLVGSDGLHQFTVLNVIGIVLVSIVQNTGQAHNMVISGGAKTELAVRWGVAGTYLKRIMIMMWSFVGLIGVAIFGVGRVDDPDSIWGAMSHQLLGPGFMGLMLAGVMAGAMSTHAAKVMAIASLLVRNIFRQLRPDFSERQGVLYARASIAGILILGRRFSPASWIIFYDVVIMVLTINLPFGAVIMLMFFWRRLTAPAVGWGVAISTVVIILVPWTASRFDVVARDPEIARMSTVPGAGVYFARVVHSDPSNPSSPLVAAPVRTNRFNFEAWLVGKAGFDVASLTPAQRYSIQYFFDATFPFVVLIVVSLLTRPSDSGAPCSILRQTKNARGRDARAGGGVDGRDE